jgi:hypothetical protein
MASAPVRAHHRPHAMTRRSRCPNRAPHAASSSRSVRSTAVVRCNRKFDSLVLGQNQTAADRTAGESKRAATSRGASRVRIAQRRGTAQPENCQQLIDSRARPALIAQLRPGTLSARAANLRCARHQRAGESSLSRAAPASCVSRGRSSRGCCASYSVQAWRASPAPCPTRHQ